MRRKLLVVLVVLLSLSLPVTTEGQTIESSKIEIRNEYIRIVVNTSEANKGRFSVGTTGGDPDRDTDQNKHLIFGGDEPWTSYTTVRIGNDNWVYGSPTDRRAGRKGQYGEMILEPTIIDDAIHSGWQLGPVEVRQILSFARSTTTGLMDTARIEYQVHNRDSVSHMVGLRVMVDTMLGANDGAPFRVNDRALLTDTVYYANEMPQFWQAFDSLSNPQVMSQGTLKGPDVSTPDRVYFTNWGSVADDVWNFDFTPGRDYTRKGEFELDSAIALFWDPVPLGPNETRSYVAQYGLGGVTIAPGDLVLGVTSPAQITADAEGFQTFSIIAYVQNAGRGESRDVTAEIKLPPGLELVGSSPKRNLGNLQVGETEQTGWQVRAVSNASGVLTYEVSVTAINSKPNRVRRDVTVVSPAKLRVFFSGPPALAVVDEKYDPSPFEIKAEIHNEGGTPAYRGMFSVLHPLGLELASGERTQKFTGPIEPGEKVELSWYLEPTGISGQLPYSLTISSSAGQDLQNNFIFVPELNPKVWIDEPVIYGDQSIRPEDYFSVSFWATNIKDFTAAHFDVSFNPNVVEVVGKTLDITQGTLFIDDSVTPPKRLPWTMPQVYNDEGKIIGIQGNRGADKPLTISYGTLVTIHFRAKAVGETDIALENIRIWDSGGSLVDFELVGRDINVEP